MTAMVEDKRLFDMKNYLTGDSDRITESALMPLIWQWVQEKTKP